MSTNLSARLDSVYLDCAASAPLDEKIWSKTGASQVLDLGNPASVHAAGVKATRVVEKARIQIAKRLSVPPGDLYFTASGTESNNWVLKGVVWATAQKHKHLVVSAIEHPSILRVADWLEQTGQAEVTRIGVNRDGVIDPASVAAALRDSTVLVSVMHVNNETGAVQPLKEIGQICRKRDVHFHSDACQSFLKEPLEPETLNLDFVTLNAHKVHGPKGVGALYVRKGVRIEPLVHGGGHEGGLRSGTLNVAGIAGFGAAVELYSESEPLRMRRMLEKWIEARKRDVPGFRAYAAGAPRSCSILNFAIDGFTGKDVFQYLDQCGICVSTSSACHSTRMTPSHVLKAMGLSDDEANAAVRLSISRLTAEHELERAGEALSALGLGRRAT